MPRRSAREASGNLLSVCGDSRERALDQRHDLGGVLLVKEVAALERLAIEGHDRVVAPGFEMFCRNDPVPRSAEREDRAIERPVLVMAILGEHPDPVLDYGSELLDQPRVGEERR